MSAESTTNRQTDDRTWCPPARWTSATSARTEIHPPLHAAERADTHRWSANDWHHSDMADKRPSGVEGPRWRVRQDDRRWSRRWVQRSLAQADVIAPDGSRYLVRVSRNLPLRSTPLGPFDSMLPQHVSLPVLVAANLYKRGRTGWSVEILRPETAWRAQHVIFKQKVHAGSDVAAIAIASASSVHQGSKPWDEEPPARTVATTVKKLMNWD